MNILKIYGLLLIPFGYIYYLFTPILRWDFVGIWVYFLFFFSFSEIIFNLTNPKKNSQLRFNLINILGISISLFILIIIQFLTTSSVLYSQRYYNLIGKISSSNFQKDISPVDVENIRIIDRETATRLGEKKIGEDPALGSSAQLGEFHIQKVNNELYWVAPLLHRGFWKWLENKNGSIGYITVSAMDSSDVKLVQKINGKTIYIKYQPNAYFNNDLERHIYFNGYSTVGSTDFTLEIDNKGNPFWVVTLYKHEIGFSGDNAYAILVINPSNGEIKEYSIEKAPGWIDRIQPETILEEQIYDWGKYKNGFWNSIFAEKEVLNMTPGMSLIYGKDNNSYWYTGITSAGKDSSTIGFLLINSRNKNVRMYFQGGATEEAARISAEGKVQEKGYRASFPIMYNIFEIPTYVLSLKDKAGLVKKIAMVSVEDYSIIGIGNTKFDALRDYKFALLNKNNLKTIPSVINKSLSTTGKISRIGFEIKSGETYYYFTLTNLSDKYFMCTSLVSPEIILTKVGDKVKVNYEVYEGNQIDIIGFENLSLKD